MVQAQAIPSAVASSLPFAIADTERIKLPARGDLPPPALRCRRDPRRAAADEATRGTPTANAFKKAAVLSTKGRGAKQEAERFKASTLWLPPRTMASGRNAWRECSRTNRTT